MLGTVSSATRSAGKYTIKWDGKDDQGNPVKPGKYTIKIEAAREHGTYQLMRQELTWNDTAQIVKGRDGKVNEVVLLDADHFKRLPQ